MTDLGEDASLTGAPCSRTERRQAWAVHAFTTSGIVVAMFAIQAILRGDHKAALIWLLITQIIDGIDGPMARAYDVKERVPAIDGYVLDLVIDFVTCVIIPAMFIHNAELLPERISLALTGAIVFTGAIWFSRTDMMTDDHWFRGFPVVWNLVAPSLFLTGAPTGVGAAICIVLCLGAMTNIPFPHPVRVLRWRMITLPLVVVWIAAMVFLTLMHPNSPLWMRSMLIIAPAYFVVLAFVQIRELKSAQAAVLA